MCLIIWMRLLGTLTEEDGRYCLYDFSCPEADDEVVHVGGIGYADGYERHSDEFGRLIEPISSRVPYMTLPGNHEFWNKFES